MSGPEGGGQEDEDGTSGKEEKSRGTESGRLHNIRRMPFALPELLYTRPTSEQVERDLKKSAEDAEESDEADDEDDDDEEDTPVRTRTSGATPSRAMPEAAHPEEDSEVVNLSDYEPSTPSSAPQTEYVPAPTPEPAGRDRAEEFAQIMQQANMGEDFTRATSGDVLTESDPAIERATTETRPAYASASGYSEDWLYEGRTVEQPPEPSAPSSSGASGGGRPPTPPLESSGFNAAPEPTPQEPWQPEGASWQQAEAHTPQAPIATAERSARTVKSDEAYYAEKAGLRRGLVAGFVTGYLLKRYLANRKMERMQQEHATQVSEGQARIDQLTSEQYAAEQQIRTQQEALQRFKANQPTHFESSAPAPSSEAFPAIAAPNYESTVLPERPSAPPEQSVVPQPQEEVIETNPHQHIEHSSWHSIVVDEQGRAVQDAIHYGEAFKQELQREQAPVQVSDDTQTPQQPQPSPQAQSLPDMGVGAPGGGYYTPAPSAGQYPAGAPAQGYVPPALDSGQTPIDHTLPTGVPDSQHLLPPPPRNPIAAALTSPWLLLILSLMLLAYFIASFI